ncbi:hypothetical protein [cf. Phormidesmis sp. LEGE 11477]|uniref:hypothetical protein n=1 Tax=cf. Phormidesmis sp. LEGE 11477 TaxID=1828680 RepID=UPI0018826F9B|nr:hypothetical protein [cf. Phormidesmis sp. LEGE 11477]MBE9061886.1 hypothetical protein [cf. Phormidesmis sp. LEGE 11477]
MKLLPTRTKSLNYLLMVGAPLSILALLCLVFWQYAKQPGWRLNAGGSAAAPIPNGQDQTAQETAFSEADMLQMLLESSGDGVGSLDATLPTTDARAGQSDLNLPSELALSEPSQLNNQSAQSSYSPSYSQLSRPAGPFARYRAEYQFPVGVNATPNDAIANTQSATLSSPNSQYGLDPSSTTPATSTQNTTRKSAMVEALEQQAAARAQTNSRNSANQSEDRTGASSNTLPNSQSNQLDRNSPSGYNSPSDLGGSNGSALPGSLPGTSAAGNQPIPGSSITAPYSPTPSQMSPPAGTTGYQVPPATPFPSSAPPAPRSSSQPLTSPSAADTPAFLYTPPAFTQPDQGRPINPRQ